MTFTDVRIRDFAFDDNLLKLQCNDHIPIPPNCDLATQEPPYTSSSFMKLTGNFESIYIPLRSFDTQIDELCGLWNSILNPKQFMVFFASPAKCSTTNCARLNVNSVAISAVTSTSLLANVFAPSVCL